MDGYGFTVPYSLHLHGYTWSNAGTFLRSRLFRLEPPYLASIAIVLALAYLSSIAPGYRGQPLAIHWGQLFAHFGYLNSVLHYDWLNDVYWTVAIEFQFYLLIAIAFPLLNSTVRFRSAATLFLMAMLGGGGGGQAMLPHWLPLFAMGIAAFQFYIGKLNAVLLILLSAVIAYHCFWSLAIAQATVGVATATLILACGSRSLPACYYPLSKCGLISYSLYLMHIPIGSRVLNLAKRLPPQMYYQYIAILAAFVVSLAGAWLFWRYIEVPSHCWAKQIGGGKGKVGKSLAELAGVRQAFGKA